MHVALRVTRGDDKTAACGQLDPHPAEEVARNQHLLLLRGVLFGL